MAGLARRFSIVIRSKISKLLDRSEDPGETLAYGYQKQVELLQRVRSGIADVVTAKKRLQLQTNKLEQQIGNLDASAGRALQRGKEDLARQALQRKQALQGELGSLDGQITELQAQQQTLLARQDTLQTKVEAFRSKKEVIKAQYSAAEAQVRISEAATGVGEEMADVGLAMQRALDKAEDMKARAGAMDELERAGAFDDALALGEPQTDLDRQLAEMTDDAAVDAELEQLKRRLGPGDTPPC